ncbi:MAG: 2OG-Fe(II) oxygenase [Kiloniellales bacterium]|nr:2OG-Fe(II) oxygenase [Kiloniellales bacterium]
MENGYPASEQGPLTPGERLCDLAFQTPQGEAFSLYANNVFGWPKALLLIDSADQAADELARLAGLVAAFGQAETHVLAVARGPAADNAGVAQRLGLAYPLLSDPEGVLHRAAGRAAGGGSCILMFDPVLRLERRFDGAGQAEAALAHARARAAAFRPVVVAAQAPVLVVPNVADPALCRRLIEHWEHGERQDNVVAARSDGIGYANPKSKVRSDVVLGDDHPLTGELIGAINRRLLPEVLKAFNFRATRMERLRIGCYDASDSGFFAAHRDNTTPQTRHRRYALTLNLNTGDYEGGYLRLPEYGAQLYAPPPGGAVVFSCSLLHLVSPVSQGRRFVVVGFFWSEAEDEIYRQIHAGAAGDTALSV